MSLLPVSVPQFNFIATNAARPSATGGTSITPGNNTYGSYTEILSDTVVTSDCYAMMICIHSIAVSAAAKDAIVTIGIDTAGGTSYTDFISHLLASCAPAHTTPPAGHWYYFPVFVPAGTAIAAKASVNNATVGTARVLIWLYGKPSDPTAIRYGYGVETIGANTAASNGTSVTSGTASDGAWTSLGSTTRPCFAWQYGMGCNDTTMAAISYYADLSYGDGTNQVDIGRDKCYISTSVEGLGNMGYPDNYCSVPAGGTIYGRLQCSGTADSGLSMAAYGVY